MSEACIFMIVHGEKGILTADIHIFNHTPCCLFSLFYVSRPIYHGQLRNGTCESCLFSCYISIAVSSGIQYKIVLLISVIFFFIFVGIKL
jgi:hypothetical protein